MRRGIRKGLTRERIVDAALQIVDAEGAEALSMRRLGAELGVVAMALYNHFPDREALLDGMAEHVFTHLPVGSAAGEDWRSRVKRIIRAVRRLAAERPNVYALAVSRPSKPKASLALMSEAIGALRQAGLTDKDAVRWYHTFLILIQGFPLWREGLEKHRNAGPQELTDLSGDEAKLWKAVHSVSPDSQFEQSVDFLLQALEESRNRGGRGK